jgi:hypothetical protein
MQPSHFELAQKTASLYAQLPQVQAIALGGSRGNGAQLSDGASDIDLYIYTQGNIPLMERRAIMDKTGGSLRSSMDLNYWGPGDEWLNASTGIEVDVVYFDAAWMEEQISRVVEHHQASLGYTTCFWRTVRQSIVFHDPSNWLKNLQQRCQIEYPERLRRNIIALNYPVMRGIIPSYAGQVEKAVKHRLLIRINHHQAGVFASHYDILQSVNQLLQPGEKRLVEFAMKNCAYLPVNLEKDIVSILLLTEPDITELPMRISGLLDSLDQLLETQGLLPAEHPSL